MGVLSIYHGSWRGLSRRSGEIARRRSVLEFRGLADRRSLTSAGKKIKQTSKHAKSSGRRNAEEFDLRRGVAPAELQHSELNYRRGNVTRPRACSRGLNCVPFLSNFFNLSRLGQLITEPKWLSPHREPVALAFSPRAVSRLAETSDFSNMRSPILRRDVLHDAATCEWHVWCEINEEAKRKDGREIREATVWSRRIWWGHQAN